MLSIYNKNDNNANDEQRTIINIHCQSGLGRAPTIIAYIMVSRCGFKRGDTIEHIRKRRKRSLNHRQIEWILSKKNKIKKSKKNCCSVM
jgi:protein-tyrosine phosphatase